MTLQTVVYITNLKNSYSIFRRTTGFGKLDSLFLFFCTVFSVASVVSFCLLFISSTGLPKGEMNFISTGGGDQETSFLVVLLAFFTFDLAGLPLFNFCFPTDSMDLISSSSLVGSAGSSTIWGVLDTFFLLDLKRGGEKTN